MAEQGAQGWIADLGREEGVSRLIRALALSDRFHVYLLLCETPRVAQAVFDLLPSRVAEEREEPVRLVRLDPYKGSYGPGEPITFEHLAERVLKRLVSPAAEECDADVIVVVDGSKALPEDDEAWAVLFQRMNERRNVIAGALRGALVVCLPRRLEPVFAHAAPDFWSIRSLAVVVEGTPPPGNRMMVLRDSGSTTRYGEVGAEGASEAAEIEAGIAKARESLTRAPHDAVAFEALQIWLDRRVSHELAWGRPELALQVAEEGVALARQWLLQEPNRAEWLHELASKLDNVGDALLARGELVPADAAYGESVQIWRRLLTEAPERLEWLHNLSISVKNVGLVQYERGDLSAAHEAYSESLGIVRRLVEREPNHTDYLRELAVRLGMVGDVQRARGDLTSADEAYAESLGILRRLLEREPERVVWLHDLSVCLDRVGDLLLARMELTPAYEAHDASLRIAQRLLEQNPTRLSLRHDLALSLVSKSVVLDVMGRPSDALLLLRQALPELESLSRRRSPFPRSFEQAALVRKHMARLEALLAPKPKRRRKKR